MLHHDGAHDFNQVVRDLGVLFYVKDKLHSIAIQDTHLRGLPHFYNFVDAAIYAIFGFNVNYLPLGAMYSEYDALMTNPNEYQGNYFIPGQAEGMYIPVSENKFSYPHPAIKIEDFFK